MSEESASLPDKIHVTDALDKELTHCILTFWRRNFFLILAPAVYKM